MAQISVKAKPGRIARTARDGEFIPDDRYVTVTETPYIRRLLDVWGDIEQEPAKKAQPVAKPANADKKEAK